MLGATCSVGWGNSKRSTRCKSNMGSSAGILALSSRYFFPLTLSPSADAEDQYLGSRRLLRPSESLGSTKDSLLSTAPSPLSPALGLWESARVEIAVLVTRFTSSAAL